ncbi:DMT family transporter [Kurthia sibirica]|uniref:EamA family transporter n=1 Tax=Kurthia sibirica TaxID=202750 RepID=A0A2U3AMY4_9BACL|nr:DMT family transporter [Kurthia sibirica]PWI25903.1 EamA family transporter [Kurthia sibirica]GEK34255.1 putative transporter YdeD [Kurthia sibirica]
MNHSKRSTGLLLVILGAVFWGVGGTVAQKLFQDYAIDVNWLVTIRLLIAGFSLLILQFFLKERAQIVQIWQNKKRACHLIIFSLFGVLAVQYTYMASIKNGNAAVATLLQYLAPTIIVIYMLLRKQEKLNIRDIIVVTLSLFGCLLLLTNGDISTLSVSNKAILWGVLSGIALAFYTLNAAHLLRQFDSLVVVGWAMLIGGFLLSFVHPPWQMNFTALPLVGYFYLFFIIFFGTMLAFWFYIESLQSLSPKETSLLGSLEPLAAVLTMVFWLNEPFGIFQWCGMFCLLSVMVLLAFGKKTPI